MAGSSSASETAEDAASEMNAAFIKRLKIAVATTIIRNKPSNVSAKEYAESLAGRLREKESTWQGRVTKLESELLKTRQELAFVRLHEAGVDVNISEDFNWTESEF